MVGAARLLLKITWRTRLTPAIIALSIVIGLIASQLFSSTATVAISSIEYLISDTPHRIEYVSVEPPPSRVCMTDSLLTRDELYNILDYMIKWANGLERILEGVEVISDVNVVFRIGSAFIDLNAYSKINIVLLTGYPEDLMTFIDVYLPDLEQGDPVILVGGLESSTMASMLGTINRVLGGAPLLSSGYLEGLSLYERFIAIVIPIANDLNRALERLLSTYNAMREEYGTATLLCDFIIGISISQSAFEARPVGIVSSSDLASYIEDLRGEALKALTQAHEAIVRYSEASAINLLRNTSQPAIGSNVTDLEAIVRPEATVAIVYDGLLRGLDESYRLIAYGIYNLAPLIVFVLVSPIYLLFASIGSVYRSVSEVLRDTLLVRGIPYSGYLKMSIIVLLIYTIAPAALVTYLLLHSAAITIAVVLFLIVTYVLGVRLADRPVWPLTGLGIKSYVLSVLTVVYVCLGLKEISILDVVKTLPIIAPLIAVLYWLAPLYPIGLIALVSLLLNQARRALDNTRSYELKYYLRASRGLELLVIALGLSIGTALIYPISEVIGWIPTLGEAIRAYRDPITVLAVYSIISSIDNILYFVAASITLILAIAFYNILRVLNEFTEVRALRRSKALYPILLILVMIAIAAASLLVLSSLYVRAYVVGSAVPYEG